MQKRKSTVIRIGNSESDSAADSHSPLEEDVSESPPKEETVLELVTVADAQATAHNKGFSSAILLFFGLMSIFVGFIMVAPSLEKFFHQHFGSVFPSEKDDTAAAAASQENATLLTEAPKEEDTSIVTNRFGMTFRLLPADTFTMGSPAGEKRRELDEAPRSIQISQAFYIGIHEVTQKQWKDVVGSPFSPEVKHAAFIGDDLPAHSITWHQAVSFCKRLSELEGIQYRLPTEAEWEYACRAGTTTAFNTGNNTLSDTQANVFDSKGLAREFPMAVGQSGPANAWGLFDMHGNLWEWCSDWSAPYDKNTVDPKGPSEEGIIKLGMEEKAVRMRIVRGGSFMDKAHQARSANRWEYAPSVATHYIGFRVVREATQPHYATK